MSCATEAEWSAAVRALWGYGYQQTWSYGQELAKLRGAKSEHVLIREGDLILAAADVRLKPLPFIGGGLAYVSDGPLISATLDDHRFAASLRTAIEALKQEYMVRRGYVLRIAPPLGTVGRKAEIDQEVIKAGFRDTIGGRRRTMRVDISRPLDQIRRSLAQKWRNGLNASERQKFSISIHEDAEAIALFSRLFDEFVARKGFGVDLHPRFYEQVQRGLLREDRLVTQFVEHEGQPVAGHVSSMLGDTCVYLLGASSPAGLRSKAAYFLQWNTIVLAKQRGLRWYDLGGVDPVGNPGVHHFKQGLGGEDVTAPGPFEVLPGGWRGFVATRAEAIYRFVGGRRVHRSRELRRSPSEAGAHDGN